MMRERKMGLGWFFLFVSMISDILGSGGGLRIVVSPPFNSDM